MIQRARGGGWAAVIIFLVVALLTMAVLSALLRKTSPGHITVGAVMVMLLYVTMGAFVVLASRLFIRREGDAAE